MSDIKMNKERTPARQESAGPRWSNELTRPMGGFGRYFGFSPFALMRDFTDEMDRIFHRRGGESETGLWAPAIDVQHSEGNLIVTAELPGLKKEEVKVELTDDALIIEGERKREHKEEREGVYQSERTYGHFYRSIPLPEGAKTDQAKAELTDGVLRISIPAPDTKKKTRQIPIEGGNRPSGS